MTAKHWLKAFQKALAPLPQSTVNTVVKEETSATTTADLGPRMQCSVCQWIYGKLVWFVLA